MALSYGNDGFLPSESFEYIFSERELPEFGKIKSPYCREITTWKFFHAENDGQVPFGFESISFDDSDWDLINVPSTWQTEGYGMPQNLLYDYPWELDRIAKRGEESVSDKYILRSTNEETDEKGIYRTSVVFSPEDIDRALYLEFSGICGSFEVYLNGQLQAESHSVYTRKRVLLSESAKPGINQLTIIVNRYDRDRNGKIIKEDCNYGFSGIIRDICIVAESLLEISNLHIKLADVPAAYVTTLTASEAAENKAVTKISHGDYQVNVDFKVRNHTSMTMGYSVKVSLLEARGSYDPYKLPFAKINMQLEAGGTINGGETVTDKAEFLAFNVAQWSDATPVQYDLVFELLDSEGRVVCAKKKRFGFRSTQIMMGKFHINDKPVTLNLVRYYEFDPKGGIAVPLDLMRQDVILMKRAGINGVIGRGFPLSDDFLNLCDQYGLYVVATADRRLMRDYIESAMNHPCIVLWGFANYGFDAAVCLKEKKALNEIDGTRPWYCGADTEGKVSDIPAFPSESGAVFGPWEDLCLDRKSVFAKNKTGRNLFESIPGRMRFSDDDADYKWIHHADLVGGKAKMNSSIGQGIVDADRHPHPIYQDIRQQCRMVNIFSSPSDPTSLTIRNIHPFAYTPELTLEWRILVGGTSVVSGKGSIPEIEPYGTRALKFPVDMGRFAENGWANGKPELIEIYMNALSHEVVFDISLKLAKDTYYANEGFEMAFYQDVIAPTCGNPVMPDYEDDGSMKLGSTSSASNSGKSLPAPDMDEPVSVPAPNAKPAALPSETAGTLSAEGDEDDEDLISRMPDPEAARRALETIDAIANAPTKEEDVTGLVTEYKVMSGPDTIDVGNDEYSFTFNRRNGAICGIRVGEKQFLKGGFAPSFYRCPSNIDRTDKSFILSKTIFSKESDYEEIQNSISFAGCSYSIVDDVFSIVSRYKSFAVKGEILVAYEIPSSDVLRVTLAFTPRYDLVRFGIRVPVDREDVLCRWYGRGPGESYYDRKNATRFGDFAAGVDKIYHPYARPSENSSHADTAAMQLSSGTGIMRVVRSGGKRFDFTVLPFTPEQMNEYLHEEQLMTNDFCELFLDFCTKEIERTATNSSNQPLKKNVLYRDTFEIRLMRK
ncbi:MAG: hypothetical protein J5685_09785 [Clostridiales bacterium]|nr:hypothetical protein [Clostridiales bacterium]